MNRYLDISYESINKWGEELCGDTVELIRTDDSTIVVLADGLGSGVKASILSSLTSKIAGTMLKEGASICETVDTIIHTLPVCSTRKIAYSTFTIIKLDKNGRVYAAEYDNPPLLLVRENRIRNIDKKRVVINGKTIIEQEFYLEKDDILAVVSDGAIHAGVGAVLNLGWQWDNVADYLIGISRIEKCARGITLSLIDACSSLYDGRPGDDTTAVVMKFREPCSMDIFAGPPQDEKCDGLIAQRIGESSGIKVVCGGTAANIIAREWGCGIDVDMSTYDHDIPPIAYIKGVDLVTEGVLTLGSTIKKIRDYAGPFNGKNTKGILKGRDGASRLANMLINECTHINFWVGMAVNPAHEGAGFPVELRSKARLVEELSGLLKLLGKQVSLNYI